jgi:hypothetical protein
VKTYISHAPVTRLIEQDKKEREPDLGIDEGLSDLVPLYRAVENALEILVNGFCASHASTYCLILLSSSDKQYLFVDCESLRGENAVWKEKQ